ncbi:TPA: hypothetical protein NKO90_004469 [Vibrio parahaemolyticus]|uniref:hypothetical protein n=1 Tax=Vibrio cholerae TaxID=666 RepID=UPI001E0DF267|nr:hypothetical protein [Vibrio cholerae]EGQ8508715.1 hypothetical protein [Vibrio parahaemolyticus]MDV2315650.1 hypothetical protein [Vibrio cholerae]HCG7666098.1 hypothetical protein [Vibrio parahaemolyticus]HCH0814696.1 hypothetical protein [Vibrio parahaemolyticus]HCH0830375.1 hypothetical protein [Vibrio parahaemolyticus]
MGTFLRDQHIKNVSVNEELLQQIDDFLSDRERSTNEVLEEKGAVQEDFLLLNYVIRFDNRGYKLSNFSDVKKYYSQASKVERIVYTLDSNRAVFSNKQQGTSIELRFDSNDPNNTYLQISSDDGDLVDSVFCGLLEIVKKYQNHNGKIRNAWTQLLIQILGVGLGFVASLLITLKVYPFVKIENAFVITFLFTFLIFSNAWGYINQQLLNLVNRLFPNIRFIRAGRYRWTWVWQSLVGGLIVAFALLIINGILDWVINILRAYVQW